MASRRSAGILLFRRRGGDLEVLLGHMGGPFWVRRDVGAWSLPKGEYGDDESPEAAARREFAEELGVPVPDGPMWELGEARQSSAKTVAAWALEGDLDPASVRPGTFTMEWPPASGQRREFPEVDRVRWFDLEAAHERMVAGQRVFLDRLRGVLAARPDS